MPRLPALTSLRFFAALAVFLHHSTDGQMIGFALGAAHGVAFFFVLSGFILAYSYPALAAWPDRRAFLVARFARIWPAHVTAIVVVCIVMPSAVFPSLSLWQVATNLTMTQTWLPFTEFNYSINGPSWSISTEFFFYFAFLFLILDFRRTWHWKLVATFLVVVALIMLGSFLHISSQSTTALINGDSLLYEFAPARLFEFTVGMCGAFLWRAMHQNVNSGSRLLWTLAEIVAIASVVATSRMIYLYRDSSISLSPAGWWFGSFSITLPAIILITVMAFQKGAVSSFLAVKPFVLLGEISYSFYLFHSIILYVIFFKYPLAAPTWILFVLSLAATLIVSYLVWWLIETPLRMWIRRLGMVSRPVIPVANANAVASPVR